MLWKYKLHHYTTTIWETVGSGWNITTSHYLLIQQTFTEHQDISSTTESAAMSKQKKINAYSCVALHSRGRDKK